VDDLLRDFDTCVDEYDRLVPFAREGQYELHRKTIERRRSLGSADLAVRDDLFVELLHSTLRAWGIGRRASRLVSVSEFGSQLRARSKELDSLEFLSIESPSLDIPATVEAVDHLVSKLAVVDNKALVVAGTKTLHHLLPDLVPPMDRAWTGAFFNWSLADPQNHQSAILGEAFAVFAEVARATRPSRLVGAGWHTSPRRRCSTMH
jgi:hypothetical protein